MQQKNLLIFFVLALAIMVGWNALQQKLWPPPPKPKPKETPLTLRDDRLGISFLAQVASLAQQLPNSPGLGTAWQVCSDFAIADSDWAASAMQKSEKKEPAPTLPSRPHLPYAKLWSALPGSLQGLAAQLPCGPGLGNACRLATELQVAQWAAGERRYRMIPLGDDTYNLKVKLTSRGGAVWEVVLTHFEEANSLGRPVHEPLHLFPSQNSVEAIAPGPSNLLLHYANPEGHPEHPEAILGEMEWKVEFEGPDEQGRQVVVFSAEVPGQGITITKTYTLGRDDYHLGLELAFQRQGTDPTPRPFRYQLVGAHGLPIEGYWYTNTYRNALTGLVDNKGRFTRDLQEARMIGYQQGGHEVPRGEDKFIQYAGIVNQYFASVIVLDERKGPDKPLTFEEKRKVLAWARPTLEKVYINPKKQFLDDITIRLISEPIELKGGDKVVHKYLLYNGPVKVRLLNQLAGEKAVPQELVKRYEDNLHLNTLTDYPFPSTPGWVTSLGWTDLIIACTNLMHWLLALLHTVFRNYGLCIMLLTLTVRGIMFPLSRKQSIASAKMQEKMQKLAPEMKKLEEKYKNDPKLKADPWALQQAKYELQKKHGVHPGAMMGSCWIIFLQMPIFMGLYYALQESIHFRLAPFLWIENLAAPDMLIWWSEKIPIISDPGNQGTSFFSFLYLGPYFNLLPVLAVGFMVVQQQLMAPPATDEQTAQTQKMMKYMMIFMGVMFYKVAAGLCIYFIVSSLWGVIERKYLAKYKTAALAEAAATGRKGGAAGPSQAKTRSPQKEENGTVQKVKDWWAEVLKQAKKK